jgi:DNA-binding LacI/PurR family transcriptional regulator
MQQLEILSPSQQVAQHLREQLYRGVWSSLMPGAPQLAEEYGIDRKTVEAALQLLEEEQLLVPQGPGKRRKIVLPKSEVSPSMRIAILLCEEANRSNDYIVEIFHGLQEEGHHAFYAPRYLDDINMDVKKVARLVKQTDADAWIVLSATREVLEWFTQQPFPSFSLFGRRRGLPIASVGPDKIPAMVEATRTLVNLGHSRIVLMARPRRRLPTPGAVETAFLNELANLGISVGHYNLPSWDENIEDYHARLESLFRSAPPTAIIADEVVLYLATLQFLARHRLRVPEDVSMICTDDDPCFGWCQQEVSRITWDIAPVVRRVLRWASIVSHGKEDLRHTLTPAKFIPGATIGPVRKQWELVL